MLLKDYFLQDKHEPTEFVNRIAHAYQALEGKEDNSNEKAFTALIKTAESVQINRFMKVYGAVQADFTAKNRRYTMNDLEEMVKDVAFPKTHQATVLAAELLYDTLDEIAPEVTDIEEFFGENLLSGVRENAALKKYIKWLEGELYPGVWSDIITYPFVNQEPGHIRKHLMIGFAPSTGKTIITNALSEAYYAISVNVQARGKFSFDAGSWNAMVNDKFLTITDDDNEEEPISEDFVKNFMNDNMAQMQASQGKRTFKTYRGSSVIATNSEEDYFSKKQVSKRIILLRLDNRMPDMTPQELDELHHLEIYDILNYVDFNRKSELFNVKNKWTDRLGEEAKKVIEYVNESEVVKAGELKKLFPKEVIARAYPDGAVTKRIDGKVVYGYFKEAGLVLPEQKPFDNFKIRMSAGLTDTKMGTIETSFNRFADNIEASADIEKQKQPMLAFFTGEKATLSSITGATGVVIDVDDSKFSSLDEIKLPYAFLAYETSNSTSEKLRYRILIPGIDSKDDKEYQAHAQAIAKELGDNVDPSGFSIAHRFFVGGKNIRIQHKQLAQALPHNDNTGLLERVATAAAGERNNIVYWALKRADEDANEDLAREILSIADSKLGLEPAEIERFAERWDKGTL